MLGTQNKIMYEIFRKVLVILSSRLPRQDDRIMFGTAMPGVHALCMCHPMNYAGPSFKLGEVRFV
jgi:hypothetical protein